MDLRRVVWAVSRYSEDRSSDQLILLGTLWEGWKSSQKAEFAQRAEKSTPGKSATLATDFERELEIEIAILQARDAFLMPPAQAVNRHRQYMEHVADLNMERTGNGGSGAEVNRHTNMKRVAKAGSVAGNVGIGVASHALHTAGIVGVATGAAIVGTAGIGLLAGAVAGTIATSVLARVSAEKTFVHIADLKALHQNAVNLEQECAQLMLPAGATEKNDYSKRTHDIVADHVLPYIITQKEAKKLHKEDASVPMLGSLESVRAVGNKINKWRTGELGFKRERAAKWLAAHFIECDCTLTKNIVASLYSTEEMTYLLEHAEYQKLANLLAEKMKAT